MEDVVLTLEDFCVSFGDVRAVDKISLKIRRGETLAVVGESGSGKSVVALSIMGLLRGGHISGGRATLDTGSSVIDLSHSSEKSFRAVRGRHIGMIFQEPMSALNPSMTIAAQVDECLVLHRRDLVGGRARLREAESLIKRMGIENSRRCLNSHPHQLSGGMRQRVMIAMAMAAAPALLIADEPTTALDASTRGRILLLIREMAKDYGTATLFITHDFGAAATIADKVAVLYAGNMLEQGPITEVLASPRHPYTKGLLASLPKPASMVPDSRGRMRLVSMPGSIPAPGERPFGCVFSPRCEFSLPECEQTQTILTKTDSDRADACIRSRELDRSA